VNSTFFNRYKWEILKLLKTVWRLVTLRRLEDHATALAFLDLVILGPGCACIEYHSDSVYDFNNKVILEENTFKLTRSIVKNLVYWILWLNKLLTTPFNIEDFEASSWCFLNPVADQVNKISSQILDVDACFRLNLKLCVGLHNKLSLDSFIFWSLPRAWHHIESWLSSNILYTIIVDMNHIG
jgi:hypothetical protein